MIFLHKKDEKCREFWVYIDENYKNKIKIFLLKVNVNNNCLKLTFISAKFILYKLISRTMQ